MDLTLRLQYSASQIPLQCEVLSVHTFAVMLLNYTISLSERYFYICMFFLYCMSKIVFRFEYNLAYFNGYVNIFLYFNIKKVTSIISLIALLDMIGYFYLLRRF